MKDLVMVVDHHEGPRYYVVLWDLSSNTKREIPAAFHELCLWHVGVDENILVTFETDWNTNATWVQQTKWTLYGQRLSRKNFHISLSGPLVDNECIKSY